MQFRPRPESELVIFDLKNQRCFVIRWQQRKEWQRILYLGQRRGENELDSVLPFYKNSQVSPNLHRETRLCQTNSALVRPLFFPLRVDAKWDDPSNICDETVNSTAAVKLAAAITAVPQNPGHFGATSNCCLFPRARDICCWRTVSVDWTKNW